MEKSVFDPEIQSKSVESKIVVAFERISEGYKVLLREQSRLQGLSPIQLQILIYCAFHRESKNKINYLAKEFNLTKATVSDSVSALAQKGLIHKKFPDNDSRSFNVCLTPKGKVAAKKGALYANEMHRPLIGFPQQRKEDLLNDLMKMINRLQKSGVISPSRMCFTCQFYEDENSKSYCNQFQTVLLPAEPRIDCPEHVMVEPNGNPLGNG